MEKIIISADQSFGKWRVIGPAKSLRGRAQWLCQCECGTRRPVSGSNLLHGLSKSCGCGARTHGHSIKGTPSPTMKSYGSMVGRCLNPSSAGYNHYRAKGITICDRWLKGDGSKSGFSCFLEDIGERPSLRHTIERVDNQKGYEPANCRWATRMEQARNRSTTKTYAYRGESLTLRELGEKYGFKYEILRHRVSRMGMTIDAAIAAGRERRWRTS